jgi:hypothetical protein
VAIEDDPDVPHGSQGQPHETLGSATAPRESLGHPPKETMGSAPQPAGPPPEEAFGGAPTTNQPGGGSGSAADRTGSALPPKQVDGGSPKAKPSITNMPLLVGIGVAILAIIAIIVSIAR